MRHLGERVVWIGDGLEGLEGYLGVGGGDYNGGVVYI